MPAMLLLLFVFTVLLAVEWKRRSRVARIGAVMLALVLLSFAQPIAHRAARRVTGLARSERILELPNWGPLSDYQSGVLTMERAMIRDIALDADARYLSLGVLVWLALIPAFRREVVPSGKPLGPLEDGSPEPVA